MNSEIDDLSVAQLKAELTRRGIEHSHCVEKSELQALLRNAPANTSSSSSSSTSTSSSTPHPPHSKQQQKDPHTVVAGTGIDGRKVVDLHYYTLLGVEANADGGKIKKAYYLQARKYHPDKNQGDPESEAMFKRISEAFQVLSDEKLRVEYDKYGPDKLSAEAQFEDPRHFFAAMFGDGRFKEFFGELSQEMALTPEVEEQLQKQHDEWVAAGQKGADPVRTHLQRMKEEEILELTRLLLARIEPVLSSAVTLDEFKVEWRKKAKSLLTENLGPDLLESVGKVYVTEAQRLRGGLSGISAGLKGTGQDISTKYSVFKGLVDVARQQRSAELLQEHQERDEISLTSDELEEIQAGMVQSGFTFIWKLGRVEALAKMRRVVANAWRDGEDVYLAEQRKQEAAAAAAAAHQKKSVFGSMMNSISKTLASPTEAERKLALFRARKLEIIEAIGTIFVQEAAPGVEKRRQEEKAAREAAAAKIQALRKQGLDKRFERESDARRAARVAAASGTTSGAATTATETDSAGTLPPPSYAEATSSSATTVGDDNSDPAPPLPAKHATHHQ
jgi:hypothetical protein